MPTKILLGILLAASWSCAGVRSGRSIPSGGLLSYSSDYATTRFDLDFSPEARYAITAPLDSTVPPQVRPVRVDIVGEVENRALVLVDSYPSQPGGMTACQSGEERFLRVISIWKNRAALTYSAKLASCREDIELDVDGLEWHPPSSTLRVRWSSGPRRHAEPEVLTLRIELDGEPIVL